MSYYNQQQPPVGVPPPQGYPPEGYPKDAYPPQGYPQGYPPQGYPPQGYPPQYAPQYPPPHQQQQSGSSGCLEGCPKIWTLRPSANDEDGYVEEAWLLCAVAASSMRASDKRIRRLDLNRLVFTALDMYIVGGS
ncbi:proline-rich family protein [Actinidia rufa]|uniref:Proline-rich family protein n=1 Tax=Actinidia rufa TaxID=165716 RepID=A0A7J0EUM6_9ERIC|nr:proline-rich family protein [Actinidia rufa]